MGSDADSARPASFLPIPSLHVAAWWQVSNPHPVAEIRLRLDAENRGTVAGMSSWEQVPRMIHLPDPPPERNAGCADHDDQLGFADTLRCRQRSATLSVQHALCRQAACLLNDGSRYSIVPEFGGELPNPAAGAVLAFAVRGTVQPRDASVGLMLHQGCCCYRSLQRSAL